MKRIRLFSKCLSTDEVINMDDAAFSENAASSLLIDDNKSNTALPSIDNNDTEASTKGYDIEEQTVEMIRENRRTRLLNTRLLNAIENNNYDEIERCLQNGASPNTTCSSVQISASHAAAYANPDALDVLLKRDADGNRMDIYGRKPLHVAAWAGNDLSVAILLGLPTDFPDENNLLAETNTTYRNETAIIDVQCELAQDDQLILKQDNIPKLWMDSLEHDCESYLTHVPQFNSGWTPLHIATYAANYSTTKFLLAAGANPNIRDVLGQTPLDVAGAACYLNKKVDVKNYVKTIQILLKYKGNLTMENSIPSNCFSALHTAVELCSSEAIEELLAAGAPTSHHNAQGNTPLHECVIKCYDELLKVFVNYSSAQSRSAVNIKNATGHTVLHMAIQYSWIPGICIALDAGADVSIKANDGRTAIHTAASKGNSTILREVLENVHDKSAIGDGGNKLEAPLLCAMRSGNLDCVRMILQTGAPITIEFSKNCFAGAFSMEYVVPASHCTHLLVYFTIHIGCVNVLRFLLDQDKSLETFLESNNDFFFNKHPLEHTIWNIKINSEKEIYIDMLKFLLERTPGIETFDPPIAAAILEEPVTSHDSEILKELLGNFPHALDSHRSQLLNQAVNCLNEDMILKLIKNGADLSAVYDGDTALSRLMSYHPNATEFVSSIFDSYIDSCDYPVNHKNKRITMNYEVLVPSQEEPLDRMRVIKSLLDTGNRRNQRKLLTHLLVETYINCNWEAFSWYLYMLIILYSLFVSSLSIYVVSVFYFKDNEKPAPIIWSPFFWQYLVYLTLFVTLLLELSYTNLTARNWKSHILSIKLWTKFATYGLTMAIPPAITIESSDMEWRRHLASLALVLAWMNLLQLISSTPMSGLFIQMFWKVTTKVLKILFSFSLLVFMFSLIFMVQFHTEVPFDGPLAAVFKTLVMMTSEFDYEDNFGNSKDSLGSILVLRLIFVIFLLLIAIVIMNLMIGVAVNDVQNLIEDGNLRRLEMQVYLMANLEQSMKFNVMFKILGLKRWFRGEKVPRKINIFPSDGAVGFIPIVKHRYSEERIKQGCAIEPFMEAIIDKAREQFDKASQKAAFTENEYKLREIHEAVTNG